MLFSLLLIQVFPKLLCQDFPVIVNIKNGLGSCSGFEDCKVDCDYGFISNGTYSMSLENLDSMY